MKTQAVKNMPNEKLNAEKYYRAQHLEFPFSEKKQISTPETRRGDCIHAILSKIIFFEEQRITQIEKISDEVIFRGLFDVDRNEIVHTLINFCSMEGVQQYFLQNNTYTIYTEKEFIDRFGKAFRCDRIMISSNAITILDFKTGGKENEREYVQQMNGYLNIVQEIYPGKKIDGLIAYVDLKCIVQV